MIYVIDQRIGAVLALNSLDQGADFKWLVADSVTVGPLKQPSGLSLKFAGWLFIADRGNNRVVIIDVDAGASIFMDSSASAIGPLRQPTGVAVTATGQLVVADTGNHRIVFARLLFASNWSAFGTPGNTTPGGFEAPTDVYVDGIGRILVADPGADRLVRIDNQSGTGWTELALPIGANKPRPYALAAGPSGGVLITDLHNSRILLLAADDTISVLIDGSTDQSLIAPVAVAMQGPDIIVADAAAARISRWVFDAVSSHWTMTQMLDGRGGPSGGPEFSSLTGLAIKEQP